MTRDFQYTVKLVVQHKVFGTLDFILKTYDTSVDINPDNYDNPFVVNSENILTEMSTEIANFCNTNKYDRADIDIISYEVTTDDPYIHIYFSESESENQADNVYDAEPRIDAYVIPQAPVLPDTPQGFTGVVLAQGEVEWNWNLVQYCAYRMYDQDNKIIREIGLDTDVFIEINLEADKNHTRKLVAYNSEGESIATEYVTVYMPKAVSKTIIPIRPLDEITPAELVPLMPTVVDTMPAFQSGIGDNLDLWVKAANELTVKEKFKFETFFEGFSRQMQKHYTAIPFKYKLKANGQKTVSEYIPVTAQCKIEAFPIKDLLVFIKSHVYLDFTFLTKIDIEISYEAADGTIQTKTVRYNTSTTIDEPTKDLFLINLMSYIGTHDADVATSPDPTSVTILSTHVVDGNPNVSYLFNETDDVYVTCEKNENFYYLSTNVSCTTYPSTGYELELFNSVMEKPRNSLNIEYDGTEPITFEITYDTPYGNRIEIIDKTSGSINPSTLTQATLKLYYRFKTPYDYTIYNINLTSTATTQSDLFKSLFPTLAYGKYYFRITPIIATGDYSYKTTTTASTINSVYDDSIFIEGRIDATNKFTCSIEATTHSVPWSLTSAEYSGVINGKEPMLKDEDGKKDYITVAPMMAIPSDVTISSFELILTDTGGKYIDAVFKNETSFLKSSVNGDVITFSSNEYEMEETFGSWKGPVVTTQEFEISTIDTIIIKAKVYNPLHDYATSTMTLTDIALKTRSLNPNVYVTPVNTNVINLNELGFEQEIEFKAKILSPSQNAWSPIIHPGYYYINNHEHFLYANPTPSGVFSKESKALSKEFFVSIKAGIDIKSNPADFIKDLSTKSSLINGEKNNVVINADGTINLTPTNEDISNPTYQQTGSYTTEALSFMTSVNQVYVVWDEFESVPCSVNAQFENGTWSGWLPTTNGTSLALADKAVKFKVKFDFERVDGTKTLSDIFKLYKTADWVQTGYSSTNMVMLDNKLAAIDSTIEANYISPVFTLQNGINSFQMLVSANHELDPSTGYDYKIEVAVSDVESDLNTAPMWNDITSLLGTNFSALYKYIRYKVTFPANSLSKLFEIDMMFNGSTDKQTSPILSNVKVSSETPDIIFAGYVSKSIKCSVLSDAEYHDVTDFTILDTIYPDILASGFSNPVIESLEVNTLDTSVELKYDNDGGSKLQAATKAQAFESDVTSEFLEVKKIDNNTYEAFLSPVPLMGRPIVIEHPTRGVLRHVTFFDEDGISLTNSETIVSTGKQGVALSYKHLDVKSLYVTINNQIPIISNVINNIVYFDEMTDVADGDVIFASYRLENSYTVDYNYDLDNNKARVLIHLEDGLQIGDYSSLKVYYENDDTSYYEATELQLNPLYNDINTGFIYLTEVINEPSTITINMTPDTFSAASNDCSFMFIKLTDEIGNAVDNIALKISAVHGTLIIDNNITNQYGIITAKYYAPDYECTDTITATCNEYGITGAKSINVKEVAPDVFVTVTSSNYYVTSGSNTIIKAKVFAETLSPYVAKDITLNISSTSGSDTVMVGITNSDGEFEFTITPFVNQPDSICRVKITCLDVVEYIDIKVVT